MNRVFVTGVGCVSAAGMGRAALLEALAEGRSGIAPIERFDASALPVRIAAEAKAFDAARHVPARLADRTDRFIQMALVATEEAVECSGLSPSELAGDRTGVAIASNGGGAAEREAAFRLHEESPRARLSPFLYAATAHGMATGWASMRYGATGPSYALANSSASGNQAIGLASRLLRWGEADVMLAGAAEASITPFQLASLDAAGVLSHGNDDPAAAYRPFDRRRDGMCVGEGAAVLVLETEAHATARGGRPLAEIAGYGAAMEAYEPYRLSPEGTGARFAIARALQDAGLPAEAVEYINAHGTGTRANDAYEARVLSEIFGDHAPVSSTKPVTGHLLGAAGAIEAAICVLALQQGLRPATPNLRDPDLPEGPSGALPLDMIRGAPRLGPFAVALNLSWGFGGFASGLVLRRV